MPYLMLSDDHSDDPRVIAAGPLAAWLHTAGLIYCAKAMTDGHIPSGQLRRLADVDNAGELAAILVRVGLWVPALGGWQLPDYLGRHGNHSKAEIADYRERKRIAMAKQREAQARQREARQRGRPVTGNIPATLPERSGDVPAPAPAPDPHQHHTLPLPLPPMAISSSTRGPIHPDVEGTDLLLLDDLTRLFEEQDRDGNYGTWHRTAPTLAQRAGVEPDDPAVALADLVYRLIRIGMERGAARRLALAQPNEVADWLDHPERWEKANNPPGLLRARIEQQPQERKEHA